jgi:CubicO group peptidase (beta-lactamase class C family)
VFNPQKIFKTMKRLIFLSLLSLSLFFSQTACEKIPIPCSGNDCFDIDQFAENMNQQLNGQVGYAYAIYYQGQLQKFRSDGYSRTPVDGGELFAPNFRMNVASISKTLTAIAVLQLLDQNNLSLNSSISPWLPNGWVVGPNVSGLTFQDLLTHNTGFRSDPNDCSNNFSPLDYNTLRDKVRDGIDLADKTPCYQNINFALFRIIIPRLNGYQPPFGTNAAQGYAQAYVSYLQQHIMEPLTIWNAECKSPQDHPVYCYPFPHNGIAGVDPGDWTLISGGGGWNLAVTELGRIISSLDQDQQLLSTNMKNQMFGQLLGCYQTASTYGDMFHHNGGLGYGTGVPNKDAGLASCYYRYPNEVVAVLYINSAPQPMFINTIMENAWLNAWN